MQTELTSLRAENSELKTLVQKNTVTIESHVIEIDRLQMELRLLRQKFYGPRSERKIIEPDIQEHLFNEAEVEAQEEPDQQIQRIQYERKKGGRRALP